MTRKTTKASAFDRCSDRNFNSSKPPFRCNLKFKAPHKPLFLFLSDLNATEKYLNVLTELPLVFRGITRRQNGSIKSGHVGMCGSSCPSSCAIAAIISSTPLSCRQTKPRRSGTSRFDGYYFLFGCSENLDFVFSVGKRKYELNFVSFIVFIVIELRMLKCGFGYGRVGLDYVYLIGVMVCR